MKLYTMSGACSLASHIALIWARALYEIATLSPSCGPAPRPTACRPSRTGTTPCPRPSGSGKTSRPPLPTPDRAGCAADRDGVVP